MTTTSPATDTATTTTTPSTTTTTDDDDDAHEHDHHHDDNGAVRLLCRLAAALGAAALLAGCGGGGEAEGDPQAALSDTAARLGEIRSGDAGIHGSSSTPKGEGERVGFELAGPFALGDETHGPRFRLDYTQLRGDEEGTVTMTSTGERAYVTVGNETYELPSDRASELTGAGAVVAGDGLGSLDVGRWLLDPELSAGDEVAGDATDRIEARLDVAAAVRDLVALARKAGAIAPGARPRRGTAARRGRGRGDGRGAHRA